MAQLVNVAQLNVLYKQLIPKIADLDVIVSIDTSQEVFWFFDVFRQTQLRPKSRK